MNENFNCLLRQYIRKGTDLSTVSDKLIADIERALNARPRKCLGYKQPVVVFNELRNAAKFCQWYTSELNSRLVVLL